MISDLGRFLPLEPCESVEAKCTHVSSSNALRIVVTKYTDAEVNVAIYLKDKSAIKVDLYEHPTRDGPHSYLHEYNEGASGLLYAQLVKLSDNITFAYYLAIKLSLLGSISSHSSRNKAIQ